MESLKNLLRIFRKIINIILPFEDFMYILQQEEYSIQRIGFWLPRFFFKRNIAKRDNLKLTQRVKVTIFLSILFWSFLEFLIISKTNPFFAILNMVAIPFYVILTNILVSPFYEKIKDGIIKKASAHLDENRSGMKIIAITGSYGKTTLKNFLEQLLKYHFRVQMIPGNINSTIGIANFILTNLNPNTEILITEIDSYKKGRIKRTSEMLKPDLAILTNIGDQHLQRYKNKENLAKSLLELFESSPKGSLRLTNQETFNYLKNIDMDTKNVEVAKKIHLDNLSESNVENYSLAYFIAEYFKIEEKYINHISSNLKLPERRQVEKELFGFNGLDDSYNISLTTAKASINQARKLADKYNKKLVVITAGIPELAEENKDSNKILGEELSKNSEKILVLKSIFYKDLISNIENAEKYELFNNLNEAVKYLNSKWKKDEIFLLLEPELTDLYY